MSHGLSNAGLKTGLAFHDPQNGWIGQITPAQAVVWVTHDGGVDWEQATLPAPAGGWGPSVEVDAGAAMPFAGSPDAVEAVATTRPTSSIRHSYTSVSGDLGRSWSAPSPLPELPAVQSSPRIAAPVAFAGPTHWWYPLGPALYETQDAGRQWRRGGTLPGGRQFARLGAAGPSSLWSIAGRPARCEEGGNCLASWTEIALLRTADGGRHWTAVPVGEGAR